MVYLRINTAQFDAVDLTLISPGEDRVNKTFSVSNRELLQCIDQLLTEHGRTIDDVGGIAVVLGEGSFTGTRLATTVANMMAFVKQIPVVGVAAHDSDDHIIGALEKKEAGMYMTPEYSGEPTMH